MGATLVKAQKCNNVILGTTKHQLRLHCGRFGSQLIPLRTKGNQRMIPCRQSVGMTVKRSMVNLTFVTAESAWNKPVN
jgi:hypothetical protein